MPNFDINSKFNKEANFSQVVFGEDGYLLETELNEMQHIQDEARASLIREQIPSGIISMQKPVSNLLDYPNCFQTNGEIKANINGQIITVPKNFMIKLSEPPAKGFVSSTGKAGIREDLVILEAWREEVNYSDKITKNGGEGLATVTNHIKDTRVGVETTRRIQWKWRIRVIDDVDFDTVFTANKYSTKIVGWSGANSYSKVTPQGGNEAPLVSNFDDRHITIYKPSVSLFGTALPNDDSGLWIAGTLTSGSKNTLKTYDGLCFAIPLFRVTRRCKGGYSADNANGANDYFSAISSTPYQANSKNITVDSKDIDKFKVGDVVYLGTAYKDIVITKVDKSKNQLTVNIGYKSDIASPNIRPKSDRPDGLYANIIADVDIYDISHRVSLTGHNYDRLTQESFAKLLRGELQTKQSKSMLKTYHGVSKTPIDTNTIYYASFDGSIKAEKGTSIESSSYYSFESSPTGLGVYSNYTSAGVESNIVNLSTDIMEQGTVEFFINIDNLKTVTTYPKIMDFFDSSDNNTASCYFSGPSKAIYWEFRNLKGSYTTLGSSKAVLLQNHGFIHYRLAWTGNKYISYINGRPTNEVVLGQDFRKPLSKIKLFFRPQVIISDFSISKVDRGANFATLPKDVMDGYATISCAFNEQRNTYTDAVMSQNCQEVIKASGETKRQFTIKQATTGKWASGDTIKIKGLSGEVLSGAIDKDTALCRIVKPRTEGITTQVFEVIVDDTSKINVGDKVRYTHGSYPFIYPSAYTPTVQSKTSNSITLDYGKSVQSDLSEGNFFLEITESSSAPVLKYLKDGTTLTNVVGTWTGLGGTELTFTFGSNTGLTNQDLQIEYSINATKGRGALKEVATEVLKAEYNGVELLPSSGLILRDNYLGKQSGSTSICPHILNIQNSYNRILKPNEVNANDVQPEGLMELYDGNDRSTSCPNTAGSIAQKIFSFNAVESVERLIGEIPSLDKIQWLKDNVEHAQCIWYGYGYSNNVYKATLNFYLDSTSEWFSSPTVSTANTVTEVKRVITTSFKNAIDSKGFVHFTVYTEPVTDTEAPAKLITDYVEFEIKLTTPTGYTVLAPQRGYNTKPTKSGVLLVRPKTREVVKYPTGSANESTNIVTYLSYIPYQGTGDASEFNIIHLSDRCLVTTDSTAGVYTKGTSYLDGYSSRLPLGYLTDIYHGSNDKVYNTTEAVTTSADAVSNYTYSRLIGSYRNRMPRTGFKVTKSGNFRYRGMSPSIASDTLYDGLLFEPVTSGNNFVIGYPVLAELNEELYLIVYTSTNVGKRVDIITDKIITYDVFKIDGAPLIKGGYSRC